MAPVMNDVGDNGLPMSPESSTLGRRELFTAAVSMILIAAGAPKRARPGTEAPSPPAAPADWLIDADVDLTIAVRGTFMCSGKVGGTPLKFMFYPNETGPGGDTRYSYSGNYGTQHFAATVDFGEDGTSFLAVGTLGKSSMRIDCPPQKAGVARYPMTGNIANQALALALETATESHGPQLIGTIGRTSFVFTSAGSSSSVQFTGRSTEAKVSKATKVIITEKHTNGEPVVVLSGHVSGPVDAMIAGLAWVPALIAGG
jgi:hypothetical protein